MTFLWNCCEIDSDKEIPGEILTCQHVAATVGNWERSRHFYLDLLGLEEVSYVEHHGGLVEVMCQTPDMIIKEYRMRPRGGPGPVGQVHGFTLDLIEWVTPKGEHLPPAMNRFQWDTFALALRTSMPATSS